MKSLLLSLLLIIVVSIVQAQTKTIFKDSVEVRVHPSYGNKSRFHHFLFGKNFREEWSATTKLPLIRISEVAGGLTPEKRGGGNQSKSLRLTDSKDREWVIRSVEKSPDSLLPPGIRQTFMRDWLDDVTSAQHPFSALSVPPLANAVGVAYSKPVIGVVAPDKALGEYGETFNNLVVLLEEREPLGDSKNTPDMVKSLEEDNDNRLLGKEMLRARLLDGFIGDWDRHGDQFRWFDEKKGKGKSWIPVPRDRDQVFHFRQGVIPDLASRDYILPTLRDFDKKFSKIKWLLFKTNFVNHQLGFQINHDEWTEEVKSFQQKLTDSVLEESVRQLPKSSYDIRNAELLSILKARREKLPEVMEKFYRFIQKNVDIRASDKNEFVNITSHENGDLQILIRKINSNGELEDTLMNKKYEAILTKEIRLYVEDGLDSVVVNAPNSPIRLRIVGGKDRKVFDVEQSAKLVKVYNTKGEAEYKGEMRKHLSKDTSIVGFRQTNPYNIVMPFVVVGLNRDDGLILGAGINYKKQEGFRKSPYASNHILQASHSSSTEAFSIRYSGEWIHALGKADITAKAIIKAPNNTINFFGRGNESVYDKAAHTITYYRTRFNTYQFSPQLRWRNAGSASFSVGPSLYYYAFDADDNVGRFIENKSLIGSYDSLTIGESKLHLGISTEYLVDKRNSKIIPVNGTYLRIQLNAYKGVSDFTSDFAQLIPEFAFYKSLNKRSTVVFADRIGGTVSVGKTAFYQSAFLGGHENLLGFRQYRFSGQHSVYNNMELRVKVADIASYILPGQFGISGFWDIGRVWDKKNDSNKWHSGVGAGIFYAPASLISFSVVIGKSTEGWYPYFTMGFRF